MIDPMDFRDMLQPYAWLWWTAGFLYNPAIHTFQACAPALKPYRALLKAGWGVWNLIFSLFSLVGFLATYRSVTYICWSKDHVGVGIPGAASRTVLT